MDSLKGIVILIFANIITSALLTAVDQPMKTLFYIGLAIADVLALMTFIKGSVK